MNRTKVKKDRKLGRQLDSTMARHCAYALLGFPLVAGYIALQLIELAIAMHYLIGIGVYFLLVSIARLLMILKFESFYPDGPQAWRYRFFALTFANALGWGVLITYLFYLVGGHDQLGWELLCFTLIIASVSSLVFSPFLLFVQAYLLALFTPICIWFCLNLDFHLAFMLAFFMLFLLSHVRKMHEIYWKGHEADFALHETAVELGMAKRESEATAKVKNEFLSNMSHEFRTPLNSVLGMLSLLGDSDLDQSQQEFQTIAMQSAESMLAMIDDILDFSKIASRSLVMDSVIFNLRKKIESCIDILGPAAHEKGLELSLNFDPNIPTRLRGDPARLMQVLRNLIANAIQFTSHGEICVTVNFEILAQGYGKLKVEVADNGIGISQAEQHRIFQAFNTSQDSQARKQAGAGLGLAVCKGLVDLMQGEIGVDCLPSGGCRFWFSSVLDISSQQISQFQPNENLNDKKVLLVDFPKLAADTLALELEQFNMNVDVVDQQEQALTLLRSVARERYAYDLVIINLCFEQDSGLLFSREMHQDTLIKDCAQILTMSLVQRGSQAVHEHFSQFPQCGYLIKPVKRDALHRVMETLLGLASSCKSVEDSFVQETEYGGGRRILLVEDNTVNQLVTTSMLTKLGFGVTVANNGCEALGMIADRRFDLILMDCQMPIMDGYRATTEIRLREQRRDHRIPIIAMTANALSFDESKCLGVGMDDYMSKPVKIDELGSKLRRWLGMEGLAGDKPDDIAEDDHRHAS